MLKRCPKCGRTFTAMQRICNEDGSTLVPVATDQPPVVTQPANARPQIVGGNRWARRPGEFAVRIETSDLRSLLDTGLVVEAGTQGLLFQCGRMVGLMQPNHYTIETFMGRLKNFAFNKPTYAVLVDSGNTPIVIKTPLMHTSDDQLIDCELQVVLALQDHLAFYANVMKDRRVLMVEEIAQRTAGWFQEVVEPLVLTSRAEELQGNPELRERLTIDMRHALEERLSRLGLTLVDVELVRFNSPTESEIRKRRGELNQEKTLAEIDAAYEEFKSQLANDENRRKMREIESEAEFSQFLKKIEHDIFRRDIVRQQDRNQLSRDYQERKHDTESARAHLLAQIELQRREERARLSHQFQMEDLRREHDEKLTSLRNQGELDEEQFRQEQTRQDAELTARLKRSEQVFQAKMQQERATFKKELEDRAAAERLEIVLGKEKSETRVEEAQQAIDLYDRYKSLKQKQVHEDRRLEHGLDEQSKQNKHAQELEKASEFNELTPEALIALSPIEQAGLLADLRKTETLKDMDERQILALFAKDSPQAAKALEEMFRTSGASSNEARQQTEKLYERMLLDKDANLDMFREMQREVMRSHQELAQNAMNVQRDTATAAATPIIVQPSAGNVQPGHAPTVPQQLVCTSCNSLSARHSRFCQICGQPFSKT